MWKQLTDITDADLGVYIDGSHCNAVDFDLAVIKLANLYIEYDEDEYNHLLLDIEAGDMDAMQQAYEDAKEAVTRMNEQLDGYYFSIEESCLYINKEEQ